MWEMVYFLHALVFCELAFEFLADLDGFSQVLLGRSVLYASPWRVCGRTCLQFLVFVCEGAQLLLLPCHL